MDSDFSQSVDYRRQILHYTLMPDHLHLVVGVILRHNGYSTHPEPASYSFYLPRSVASQLDNSAMDRLLGLIEGSLSLTGGEQVTVEVEPDGEGGTLFHAVSNHPDGVTGQASFNLNNEQWFVLDGSSAFPAEIETVEPEPVIELVEEEIEELPEPVVEPVEEEIEELPEPVVELVEEEIEELPESVIELVEEEIEELPELVIEPVEEEIEELPEPIIEPVEEEIEELPEPVIELVEEEIEELPEPVIEPVEEEIEELPEQAVWPEVEEEVETAPELIEEEVEAQAEPAPPVKTPPADNGWHHLEIDCSDVAEIEVSESSSGEPTLISQPTSAFNRNFAASLREEFVDSLPETDRARVRDAQSLSSTAAREPVVSKGLNYLAIGLVTVTILAVVAGILLIWQPPFIAGMPEQQATATSIQLPAPAVIELNETLLPPTDEPTLIPLTPTVTTEPVRGLFNYIVNENDTIVGLADRWGLDPTSILLCNPNNLPTALAIQVGMELRIPPEDGACINADGDSTIGDIAEKYDVEPDVIINSPHNGLSGLSPDDTPAEDMLVFIPGGTGTFQERNWSSEVTINLDSDIPVVNYAPDHPGSCGEIELLSRAEGTGEWASPMYFYQRITQGYHPWHLGIDLASPMGTPIFAADRGTIVFSGWNNWGYGNLIILDHGNGWASFYGHLEEIHYDCGEIVQKGDVIGQLGSTGNSTGPHLHFEIHEDGRSLNPQIRIDF